MGYDTLSGAIVMELMEGGDLSKAIKVPDLDVRSRVRMSIEIGEGLEYLHTKFIVHRDLSLRNVLLTKDGHCKLSDIGGSRVRQQLVKSAGLKFSAFGAPMFASPE